MDRAVGEMLRQIGDVFDLAVREPAGAQLGALAREHPLRGDLADAGNHAVPDALRGFHGNLLADDRARKREERLAARYEEDPRVRAHDAGHHRVAPRERALRAIPVFRLH